MKIGANDRCACHSGRKYKACCRPLHDGQPPPSPESLMRSRYSAYALGLAEYILRTTHPDGPHFEADRDRWLAEVQRFSASAAFTGLRIDETAMEGEVGFVRFVATLEGGGKVVEMAERSRFEKVAGLWRYHSGVRG